MRETRKIATLIAKRYKMEYTLTASETRMLDKWKSLSDEHMDILNKLIEIFNEKVNLPFSPPTDISVLISKYYWKHNELPLSESDLVKLNEWRKSSPEHEEWFNRMKPNEASASIQLSKKELRKIEWMALRAWLTPRPIRKLLFYFRTARKKKPIPKKTVALIEQVLESRNL
jgi:hypothetical protein